MPEQRTALSLLPNELLFHLFSFLSWSPPPPSLPVVPSYDDDDEDE
jgi:hypothetical protein